MSDAATMFRNFTIAAGQTESDAQDVQGYTLVAVGIPSAWTTANLTFKGDITGTGTFKDFYETDGTAVLWTVANADNIITPIGSDSLIGGVVKMKIVSSAAQASERVLVGHFIKTIR